jgi:hypothetical protein
MATELSLVSLKSSPGGGVMTSRRYRVTFQTGSLLPYLSGVPTAGRSLDQRQLDLCLVAQLGAESQL